MQYVYIDIYFVMFDSGGMADYSSMPADNESKGGSVFPKSREFGKRIE